MIIEIISGKAREHTGLEFSLNLCILFYMTALFQLQAGSITIPATASIGVVKLLGHPKVQFLGKLYL